MLDGLLLFVAATLIGYAFYKWATINNDFFEKQNVKYLKPRFLVGNTGGFYFNKYTATEYSLKIYNAFPDEPVYGMFDFRVPEYVVRGPEAIKQIAIKDFDYFEDHKPFIDERTDRLVGNTLFFLRGERWRHMRATLSPAFTGSKMRQMFDLVAECASNVGDHFNAKFQNGETVNIETKDFSSRYTSDVIASCAFGLRINSFDAPQNEFYVNGKTLFNFTGLKNAIKLLVMSKMPNVASALGVSLSNGPIGQSFSDIILDTMKVRKENSIQRADMINMMMQIRDGNGKNWTNYRKGEEDVSNVENVGSVKRDWNDDEIVAQCFLFFVAGFDTTSSLLSFVLYELAINPEIQQRLHEEIAETNEQLNGKNVTYDALQKMKYLDQVVNETLRKWPPVELDRVCVKDYIFDDGQKLKFKMKKGTSLIIPVYAIHHDPKYYPNPERFDPERFSDENKDKIQPATFIPFDIGQRACIGSRFALMAIKTILYGLVLHFSFEPNAKTQVPLELKTSQFFMVSKNGIHVEMKLRKA